MVATTATIHHYDKYAVFCLDQQRMKVYFTTIVYGHCDAFVLFFFLFASVKTWVSPSSFLGERVHDP